MVAAGILTIIRSSQLAEVKASSWPLPTKQLAAQTNAVQVTASCKFAARSQAIYPLISSNNTE
jgi:hypothetical protein